MQDRLPALEDAIPAEHWEHFAALSHELRKGQGAAEADVRALLSAFKGRLPDDFIAFVLKHDGVAGNVGSTDIWISLFPVAEMLPQTAEYIGEEIRGALLIGTDGSGRGYLILTRGKKPRLIRADLIGLLAMKDELGDSLLCALDNLTEIGIADQQGRKPKLQRVFKVRKQVAKKPKRAPKGQLLEVTPDLDPVSALKFSGDGKRLFCAFAGWTRGWSAAAAQVEQYDTTSGQRLTMATAPFDEADEAPFINGSFSHDGRYFVLTRRRESNDLLLYNTQANAFRPLVLATELKIDPYSILELPNRDEAVVSLFYDQDGFRHQSLWLISLQSGALLHEVDVPGGPWRRILNDRGHAVWGDHLQLFCATDDGSRFSLLESHHQEQPNKSFRSTRSTLLVDAQTWNTRRIEDTIPGAFSADGRRWIVGENEATSIWDVDQGEVCRIDLPYDGRTIFRAIWIGSGDRFLIASPNGISIYETETGNLLDIMKAREIKKTSCLAVSADGKLLATWTDAGGRKPVWIWKVP